MQEENIQALSCQQFELITESNIKINGLSNINESLLVHYLIYRIDNLQNGKHYIGQHQTQNPLDDYMGSGKYLLRSISKDGVEKFVKTILFDFDNFEEMNEKEKELIPLSACYPHDKMSYNLKEGGSNGKMSELSREKISQTRIQNGIGVGEKNSMYGKNWQDFSTPEKIALHNQRISQANIGNKAIQHLKENDPQKYEQWRQKNSKNHKGLMCGQNHPMYGKNPLANMTPEAFKLRSQKISTSNRLAASKKTKEEKEAINQKRQHTRANRTLEQIQKEFQNRHNATSGNRNGMYGKSLKDFLTKQEYEEYQHKLSENNAMRGHSCTDFMSPEDAKKWRDKVSTIWSRLPKEQKAQISEKRRKAMCNRKWMYKKDTSGLLKRSLVKIDQIHQFLDDGWIIGIPPKNII